MEPEKATANTGEGASLPTDKHQHHARTARVYHDTSGRIPETSSLEIDHTLAAEDPVRDETSLRSFLGLNIEGSSTHYTVAYDATPGTQAVAAGVLATCDADYNKISAFFGGITPGKMSVLIKPGISGAYHYGCGDRTLYCGTTLPPFDINYTRALVVAEAVEVFEDAFGAGWDCGASHGEGLSRVLADELYPSEPDRSSQRWLDGGRPNWVDATESTDLNPLSYGCATLFLNFLRYQLGFSWTEIIQAGAKTLGEIYTNLTGRFDGFVRFLNLVQLKFPSGTPSGLTTNNAFPIPEPTDLFVVASDGFVHWSTPSTNSKSVWAKLPGLSVAPGAVVSAVSRVPGEMDVFVVAKDGGIYSNWRNPQVNGNAWNSWFRVGTLSVPQGNVISAISRAPDHLDLLTVDGDGKIQSTWWDGQWHPWYRIGPADALLPQKTVITTISRAPDHMDIFAVGFQGEVWSNWFDALGWHSWYRIGDAVAPKGSTVSAVSRGPMHIDLFVTSANGGVYSTWFDALGWHPWYKIDGAQVQPGTPITAISRFPKLIDLFLVGLDDQVWGTWFDGGGWHPWSRIASVSVPQQSHVAGLARRKDHLDLFVLGLDYIWGTSWDAAKPGAWDAWGHVTSQLTMPTGTSIAAVMT